MSTGNGLSRNVTVETVPVGTMPQNALSDDNYVEMEDDDVIVNLAEAIDKNHEEIKFHRLIMLLLFLGQLALFGALVARWIF